MKKYFAFIALIFCAVSVHTASAHIFKTDGDITVLLHANPDDDPIAKEPASLLFGVTDTTNKFTESACDCKVAISRGNATLLSTGLLHLATAPSLYSLTIPFTFPERAVYNITVTGTPKTPDAFQPFKTSFNLRVDRASSSTAPHPATEDASSDGKNALILGTVIILAVGLGLYFKNKIRSR